MTGDSARLQTDAERDARYESVLRGVVERLPEPTHPDMLSDPTDEFFSGLDGRMVGPDSGRNEPISPTETEITEPAQFPTAPFMFNDNEQWRGLAACGQVDPETFFTHGETGRLKEERLEAAKVICRGCVVQADCLKDALEKDHKDGVWGGYDEDERKVLSRRRNAAIERIRRSKLRD